MVRNVTAAGAALVVVAALLVPAAGRGGVAAVHRAKPPQTVTLPSAPLWQDAGAVVWHTGDVDPGWLGQQLKAAGFGWVAVQVNSPPDADWIARFRASSGLLVGGWSVLGQYPQYDATTAAQWVAKYGLSFYIADAEEPYSYSDLGTTSDTRFARSRVFVAWLRRLQPTLPAGVTSYCRPDRHDLDWNAWAKGGFEFLPQAYVNDFGMAAAPRLCTNAAAKWFPKSRVHPMVASYAGDRGAVPPLVWAQLLHAAGTSGFSIYPAEAGMNAESWRAFGANIGGFRLAARPDP